MKIAIIIFAALAMLTSVIYFLTDEITSVLQNRKTQSKNLFKENILKQRLEAITKKKVKFSKRHKIETLCIQAGFKLSYAEYFIISAMSAIAVFIFSLSIMKNIYLSIVFLFVGYFIPNQVISFWRNRRINLMERQVGSFLNMVLKRYDVSKDFSKALEMSMEEFRGEEPFYAELKTTVLEIKLGTPITEALDELARRTGNKYMTRLSDYYKIASAIGTDDVRKKLLYQAYLQFEENRKAKAFMKREIAGPKREAYIMLATIPVFALYQTATNPDYINFMTNTPTGKVGTTVIAAVFLACIWFINAKIGAPIE